VVADGSNIYNTFFALTACSQKDTLFAMFEIRKTEQFSLWLDEMHDIKARARIQARIERLSLGNSGDVKPVGAGVSELRIDYGPGYRVYFKKVGRTIIILLVGGDKSSQSQDIKNALTLARNL
jgi:putative addiction module killer protein